eukprot:scaffold38088_cov35-Attheya_sp.AAC.5
MPCVAYYRMVRKSGMRNERTATRSGQRKPSPCKLSGINANSRAYSGMVSSCVAWPMMLHVVVRTTTLVRSEDHSRLLSGRASSSTCARMSAVWGSGNSRQSVLVSSSDLSVNFVRNDVWKGLLPVQCTGAYRVP